MTIAMERAGFSIKCAADKSIVWRRDFVGSYMTDAAFLRTLRMRYRSAEQPEITADEARRLLDIASDLRIFRDINRTPGATDDVDMKATTRGAI